MTRVLVVDPDPDARSSLALLLREAGYAVTVEEDPELALSILAGEPIDMIICAATFPQLEARAFLVRYRSAGGRAPLVVNGAVEEDEPLFAAMREGAYDRIDKPLRPAIVLLTLRRVEERERLRREVAELRATVAGGGAAGGFVVESPAMRRIVEQADRIAGRTGPVLLVGERGTGKEVLARFIHQRSPRAVGRFIAVNCRTLGRSALGSELFGYAHGAFVGAIGDRPGLLEEADGGTLLLDGIEELPVGSQPKLMEAIEKGVVRRAGEGESVGWTSASSPPPISP